MRLRAARKETSRYSSYIKKKPVGLKRGSKKQVNSKKQETGRFPELFNWLKCAICQKESTERPHCPVHWRPHDSGAGYLTFEQKLTSYYEAEELSLAVD